MSNPTCTFLNGSAARHTNILTTANAEAGTGWTNNAPATVVPAQTAANSVPSPFNGWDQASSSAWAYGCRLAPGAGGTYSVTCPGTYGAGVLMVSCFVRRPRAGDTPSSATPADTFTIGVVPGGTGQTHGHRFAWDATSGQYILSTNIGNGRGVVLQEKYADGWQRVAFVHQIGWDTDGTADTTVSGDTLTPYVACQNSKNVDVWGVMVEQLTAVTAGGSGLIDVRASQLRASPYLDGVGQVGWDSNLGPLGFQPPRSRYHKGIYQVKSTVTGTTFTLLRRASTLAPWEAQQSSSFADTPSTTDFTKCYEIEVAPEYRLAITALAATGVQGAWLAT